MTLVLYMSIGDAELAPSNDSYWLETCEDRKKSCFKCQTFFALFTFSRCRRFFSPGLQRWQKLHEMPSAHFPLCTKAQGLHCPRWCLLEPALTSCLDSDVSTDAETCDTPPWGCTDASCTQSALACTTAVTSPRSSPSFLVYGHCSGLKLTGGSWR